MRRKNMTNFLSELNDAANSIFKEKYEMPRFDFSNFFEHGKTRAERKNLMDEFKQCCIKNNKKVPREYWNFLVKLMSYRLADYRSKLTIDDIKVFFIGKNECGKDTICFFDSKNNYNEMGVGKCIDDLTQHDKIISESKRKEVIKVLRNIANIAVSKYKQKIIYPTTCAISGKTLYSANELHIDHYNDDFSKVAYDWLHETKYLVQRNIGKPVDICNYLWDFIDEDKKYFKYRSLNLSFYRYHNTHTHLRIVDAEKNLKRPKYKPNWDFLKINGYYKEKYAKEHESNK